MRIKLLRMIGLLACGLWLAGCTTNSSFSDMMAAKSATPAADSASGLKANALATEEAADEPAPLGVSAGDKAGLSGSQPYDDLSTGKRYYRAGNYGMAERYYRRAVEMHPRDAESWLGLAACYDQLRRFDLADRAYAEATKIVGATIEILNNEGYSYMLRGDYAHARAKLAQARKLDPSNRFVQNNLQLLATAAHSGKGVE